MRKKRRVLWVFAAFLLLPTHLMAQPSSDWQPTLESAKRLASQTNRLVLVYFWADWCGACRKMEHEVLAHSNFTSAVKADYVPVKVNADHFPATARQYGVTALPTTIVLDAQGQAIDKLQGRQEMSGYLARLNRVAAMQKPRDSRSAAYAGINSRPRAPAAGSGQWNPPQQTPRQSVPQYSQPQPRYAAQGSPAQTNPRLADARAAAPPYGNNPPLAGPSIGSAAGPPASRPDVGQPSPETPAIEIPPGNPPLGLDGYCPVSLADDSQKWTLGDRRWGAIHEGRTYLFAGAEQQQRFLSDPQRFAPVFGGNDIVKALEAGESVSGRREHGAFFGSKVYLFASEETLAKFWSNPNHYANGIAQMTQGGEQTGNAPNLSERNAPANPWLSNNPRGRHGGYQGPPPSQPPTRYR